MFGPMSGTLFVVATPIGNLEDITLRALRVLREVDLIAAEDTRRTAKLLAHYAIATPTISFHEHNSRSRLPTLLAKLEAGASMALVSDAGTPGVADPGVAFVRACWQHSIPVDPIPGACASLTAAVTSGFPLDPLTIYGFVPARSNDRTKWLRQLQGSPATLVFFEAPHRILRTLTEMSDVFGDRPISVARELTKLHQQITNGSIGNVIGQLTDLRGEFTVVVGPAVPASPVASDDTDQFIYGEFCQMTNLGLGRRAAISELAERHGRTAKSVYSSIELAKKSNES